MEVYPRQTGQYQHDASRLRTLLRHRHLSQGQGCGACVQGSVRGEKEREITEVAQTDFLALEQHLTHAVYGNVEDGADVSSRINTAMRGDVLGKLLDGHDVGVL